MREQLEKEKKLLAFYNEMVNILLVDRKNTELFLEQIFISMLLGHEFGVSSLSSKDAYEILITLFLRTRNVALIDNSYYSSLIENKCLTVKEQMIIRRLVIELETGVTDSIAVKLLGLKNKNCINLFQSFIKLRDILRNGWIKRGVKEEYVESDAIHIVQMLGFANAYFFLFKPRDLSYTKVIEMVIIHEMGEILVGDITELDPCHATKHSVELEAVKTLFSGLDSGDYFIKLWEEFEGRESNEARFVYELDKFDPIVKADYLDSKIGRKDLFRDFYSYEEERGTFKNGY